MLRFRFEVNEGFNPEAETPQADVALSVQRTPVENASASVAVTCSIFREEQPNRPFWCDVVYQAKLSVPSSDQVDALREFSRSAAAGVIVPYIRESIANASVRAGFPPLVLPPVNISTLMEEAHEPSSPTGEHRAHFNAARAQDFV
jgi:preprotein translocase subunit SecB